MKNRVCKWKMRVFHVQDPSTDENSRRCVGIHSVCVAFVMFFFVQVSNAFFRRCSFQSEFKVFSVNTGNAFGDAPIYIFQCLVFQLQRIYFHFDGEPNEK